ncbi:hypothetical protein FRC02_012041 [Tulasnella sp. 418]|nr:hypothetical protein FRC02_012041 [Tulasnella sp. 418]
MSIISILTERPLQMARNLEMQMQAPMFPAAMPAPSSLQPQYSGYGQPPMVPQRYGPSPAPYSPAGYPAPPLPPQQPAWNPPPPAPLPIWQTDIPSPGWNPSIPPVPQPPPAWASPAFPASPGVSSPYLPQSQNGPSFSSLSQSFANLTFTPPNPPNPLPAQHQQEQRTPSPGKGGEPPAVVASLPTVKSLTESCQSVSVSADPAKKIAWSKQVLALVDRTQAANAHDSGKDTISDPNMVRLTDTAIQHILNISGNAGPGGPVPSFVAEALYLKGTLSSSGSFPAYLPKDPRAAFKDYEAAARAGHNPAWFKLGRDYESVGDVVMAKQCFETGLAANETSCLYRLGMATLLGQLGLPKNPALALRYLRQAADQADLDAPQPSYVYGMILLGEFEQVDIPMSLIMAQLPLASSSNPDPRQSEARRRIERAAYLAFAPAQYKLGWSYEYAKMGCPFDPLLSVQYYSLASQQGETEADMALSKWFLCGSQGAFEKDEILAVTFAEKAAKKGLPSAEFAMGYYCEVGVGGHKDIDAAKKWYQRAAAHQNEDAAARLKALSQPKPDVLSREEHDKLTNTTLVRKRTSAKEFSIAEGRGNGERKGDGSEIIAVKKMAEEERAKKQYDEPLPPVPPLPGTSSPASRSPRTDQRPLPGPGFGARKQQQQQQRPRSTASGAAGPSKDRLQQGRQAQGSLPTPPVTSPHGKKGPATFAEMGFQSAPIDDKDCVIM